MTLQKEGKYRQMLTGLTKGGGGVGEMLTMADEGGRGGLDSPFLADIFFEQPLSSDIYLYLVFYFNDKVPLISCNMDLACPCTLNYDTCQDIQ